MPTRDVSKDVANVVEFCRLVAIAVEADDGADDEPIDAVFAFLSKLDTTAFLMLMRGLTHVVVTTLTADSQITMPGSTDEEDRVIERMLWLERHGERTAGQLLTVSVLVQSPLLAAKVATGLAMPIATLVQSGRMTLPEWTSKGEN